MDLLSLMPIIAVFVLAGLVKGTIGLGLPTVAMGLLSLAMVPVEAAALLVLPSLVTNVWQMAAGGGLRVLAQRLWPTLLAIFVATVLSMGIMTGANTGMVAAGLGAALLIYAALGLSQARLRVPPRWEGWAGPCVGAATGVMTGATGVFVVPAVPYLAGLGLSRDDLVQALGLCFTASTLALAAGLLAQGVFAPALAGSSALAVAPALLGMYIGNRLRARLDPARFRRWFFAGLGVLGLHILWQAFA